ncbi:MAG: DUF1092 family protein [Symploca sp. SIO3E6]|nr:DUF1092 family protein [Caldora sp. SIO3E6]
MVVKKFFHRDCLLPPAFCLLPPAFCLLPPASCLLPPSSCLLPPASCPLAGWMSGLELAFVKLDSGKPPRVLLETGASESWILASIKDSKTIAEAQGFESAKQKAQQVHFLAVQSNPTSETFAGFWLLQEVGNRE